MELQPQSGGLAIPGNQFAVLLSLYRITRTELEREEIKESARTCALKRLERNLTAMGTKLPSASRDRIVVQTKGLTLCVRLNVNHFCDTCRDDVTAAVVAWKSRRIENGSACRSARSTARKQRIHLLGVNSSTLLCDVSKSGRLESRAGFRYREIVFVQRLQNP